MKAFSEVMVTTFLLCVLCSGIAFAQSKPALDDIEFAESMELGREYQIGETGLRGVLGADHVRVTHVSPGSAADGKVEAGDLLKGFQYYGLGPDFGATLKKRLFRLGRDWHYRLTIVLERPGSNEKESRSLIVHLQLPPRYGLQHHYGPTGFFAKRFADHLEVDHIDSGSPADGKLLLGDHIVAVGGHSIGADVFKRFTESIDQAESYSGAGKLPLTIRRKKDDGSFEILNVELRLEVLGDYNPANPFKGEKADKVVKQIADAIIRDKAYGKIDLGLLGLLATGEDQYIKEVGALLKSKSWAQPDVKLTLDGRVQSWHTSYHAITMCEYYLITQDKSVLPAIREHAITIARGQDAAGLWNHRFANPANNFGQLHGRLNGYGALNQTSMTQWMAMILARKCGIDDPEVDAAIAKTHAQFRQYVGRGALPYGNHPPQEQIFTNNGTSASAAVAFQLIGDLEGARFFAMMSAAGHQDVLTGHTGPFFNVMWSALGANVAGPETLAAFNSELHWLRTIARRWDGRCVPVVAWGAKPGREDIGSTASELLNACLGRRALYVTGKGADQSLWLDKKDARKAVDAWQFDQDSRHSLLEALSSSLPPVRLHAAEMLAFNDDDVEAEVLTKLTDESRDTRIGALHAVRWLKLDNAREPVMNIIRDETEEVWVRVVATRALVKLKGAERHGEELLGLIVHEREGDPFGELDMGLGRALAAMEVQPYQEDYDRDLFYKAVEDLLHHKHVYARQAGMNLIEDIPLEEFHRIADLILYIVEDKDRSYTSYHYDAQRQTGLEILYRLGIEESLGLTVGTIKEKLGRLGLRRRGRTKLMKEFGSEAKPLIPRIREVLGKDAEPIVESIENATESRKMISFEEAKAAGTL